jgi:hypothetical protein
MHFSRRTFDAYRQEQLDAAMPVLIFELYDQDWDYLNKPVSHHTRICAQTASDGKMLCA